ncbi:MAG: hypothetical protein KAY32_17315 [Candidatus Eisenbacteria sp.]|nr:hypothetical protein [Candidatus Eisenbacteria bacterium]
MQRQNKPESWLDLETSVVLELMVQKLREGEKAVVLEAGRVALWYLEKQGLEHAGELRQAMELAVERWSTGCIDPEDPTSEAVLCIGEALGVPHRTKAPGKAKHFITADGSSWLVANWVRFKSRQLAADMTRGQALTEIARRLCVSLKTVERIFDDQNKLLRSLGWDPPIWKELGRRAREERASSTSDIPPSD